MHKIAKYTAMAVVAGTTALVMATPSQARHGRNAAAIGGFVAGAAIGAAVANSNNGYYASGPGYYYDEPAYAYEPEPTYYSGPSYRYYAPRQGYGPRSGTCDSSLGNQRC